MSNSLWPDFSTMTPPRGMRVMLYETVGDPGSKTNGAIEFYVDTLGISAATEKVRHNCYLRLKKTGYTYLLFRVTTPVPGPWPAKVHTPEGDNYPEVSDETQLRSVIEQVIQRDRTTEVVLFLMSVR